MGLGDGGFNTQLAIFFLLRFICHQDTRKSYTPGFRKIIPKALFINNFERWTDRFSVFRRKVVEILHNGYYVILILKGGHIKFQCIVKR